MIPVFDGHNDTILRVVAAGSMGARIWQESGGGHLDLPAARAGGLVGGFFAIWVPSAPSPQDAAHQKMMETPPFALPLPDEIPADIALASAFAQAAALRMLERTGTLSVVTSIRQLRDTIDQGRIAAIMHMEGAEAIADPDSLHLWHGMGLRSLGPVWSRPTRYAHGVPFAFPADPDIGPGLTEAGRQLVRDCNRLGIMLDLSHMNAAGLEGIARLSDAPLVASHSAVHALCASSRNLTDRQLRLIAESGGLVGLNFASGFLRPDGRRLALDDLDVMLRHLDHLLTILGEDGVAFGSDFDGALMPRDIPNAAALPRLIEKMRVHGYGETLIRKIASENWINVLGRTWHD
ncbi:MAG: dipeptidase [Paracoccus sp. (in: a-proteobacteria)]|nr:dipeptidase [Paracoccus sp. (in: a-proteobacteria)]